MTELTVKQVANICGRSQTTVRRWIKEGKIKGHKIAKQWFIPESELLASIGNPLIARPTHNQLSFEEVVTLFQELLPPREI